MQTAGGLAVDFVGNYDSIWIASIAMGLVASALNFAISLPPVRAPAALSPA